MDTIDEGPARCHAQECETLVLKYIIIATFTAIGNVCHCTHSKNMCENEIKLLLLTEECLKNEVTFCFLTRGHRDLDL